MQSRFRAESCFFGNFCTPDFCTTHQSGLHCTRLGRRNYIRKMAWICSSRHVFGFLCFIFGGFTAGVTHLLVYGEFACYHHTIENNAENLHSAITNCQQNQIGWKSSCRLTRLPTWSILSDHATIMCVCSSFCRCNEVWCNNNGVHFHAENMFSIIIFHTLKIHTQSMNCRQNQPAVSKRYSSSCFVQKNG